MRRIRGRFFQHKADLWIQADIDDDGAVTDASYVPLAACVECWIQRQTREDSVTLLGRMGLDAAVIFFPGGTALTENSLVMDRTPGPNYGACWMVHGTPVDEPPLRRGGANMLRAVCQTSIRPAEVKP